MDDENEAFAGIMRAIADAIGVLAMLILLMAAIYLWAPEFSEALR